MAVSSCSGVWPSSGSAASEIIAAYAYRSDLEVRRWWDLFQRAERQIDLLGYTLYFLPQQHPSLADLLRDKAQEGCQIRLCLADPDSGNVQARDAEERRAITLVARISSTMRWLEPLLEEDCIEARFQQAPLYSSIFRFDDQMLVTPHLYAIPGHAAPLLHLRRLGSNGVFSRFATHFEGIWADTRVIGEDRERTPVRSGS